MLPAALAYAERFGWAVFPVFEVDPQTRECACPSGSRTRIPGPQCGNAGKHPRTRRGHLEATTDRRQIESWWQHAPSANIGIATGIASRLIVLDIDPRNGGDENLEALIREYGALPETPMQLTGGGGRHYFFRRPDTPGRLVGRVLAQGVDVKADGGYVVAAPSTHVSGRSYAWEVTARPDDLELSEPPWWITERLKSKGHHAPSRSKVTHGFLGAAFAAAGWLGHPIGPDKAAARCPWEDEHTTGSRFDSSTVVYAPAPGKTLGAFFCSHEHCRHVRSHRDVLAALPDSAKDEAAQAMAAGGDARERAEGEAEPAPDAPGAAVSEHDPWERALRFNADRQLTKDPGNVALLLANRPEWRGCLAYDEFANVVVWARPVPSIHGMTTPSPGDALADQHIVYVQHWFALHFGVSFGRDAVQDAVAAAARENRRHPLREYLSALEWDGVPRLSGPDPARPCGWLSTYLGADRTPYTATVGRLWLISAVARAFRPGCQADHLLILEGDQGGGKSSAARILAVQDGWFRGAIPDLRSKDAAMQLAGAWICEIGELDAFRGASGTRVKDWVTQTIDTYRPPYGRCAVKQPRQCVFIGTTNDAHYLRDASGARRFWPVATRRLDRDALIRDRDQLWAEARYLFDSGAPWWPGRDAAPEIEAEQGERFDADEWEAPVTMYVRGRVDDGVSVGEVLQMALKIGPDKWSRADQMRVATCLRRLSWFKPTADLRNAQGERLWFPRPRS